MQLLDLTLPTPEENLALDEALLNQAERGDRPGDLLRLWQPVDPLVVIGRASKRHEEVNIDACLTAGVPVLRRTSGGAAIVTGRGCLMYAVVLSYDLHPELHALDQCHQYVMGRIQKALAQDIPEITFQGTCDLTYRGKKFSGNSLRCKRTHLIYHGTILYDFDLPLIHELLRQPPRMPDYRENRPHDTFVINVPIREDRLRAHLKKAWEVEGELTTWPQEETAQLATDKYADPAWTTMR